jgi:DNA-binding transcriptional regulator YiaG
MTPQQIRDLRLDLGLTQGAFAKKLGLERSTISVWEAGKKTPSPLSIRKLEKLILTQGGKNA